MNASKGLQLFQSLIVAALLLLPVFAHAQGPNFSAGLGFEFSSGTYGTSTRTDAVYVPFTASVSPTDRLGFSLEIPWIYQSNAAANTTVFAGAGGHMMAAQKSAALMTTMMGGGSNSTATTSNVNQSQNGLGDIIAKGGYVLVPEGDLMPRMRPYLQVKFPTADKNKALGTGTFSEGIGVELLKQIDHWYAFTDVAYIFQGKSDVLPLKNYLGFNAGAGYAFGDKFLPMLIIKGSTPPVAGSTELLEARLKLKYQVTTNTGIEGYVAKGITTNSPDYGGGVAAFYDF